VVDDNVTSKEILKEILEGAGLIVVLANNGQEAVDAVTEAN
jgi:CheY-like chemotaxis protein